MMKRFGFNQFGGPQVFASLDAARPEPKPGQVQLQVLGFGLNPYDASLRRGEQQASRPLAFPIVPGTDVVGRITALGVGVSGFELGDVVMNFRPLGGYSEYVTASATKVLLKPTALSFQDAAAMPQVGIAAYTILTQLALKPGASLAIVGAAGGIGSLLLQLAKANGIQVLAVADATHHDALKRLQGFDIVSYAEAEALPAHQYPAVVNARYQGADDGLSRRLVASGGKLLTTAYVPVADGDFKNLALTKMAPTQAAFNALATAARTWGLTMRIAEALPFSVEGVRRGHALLDAGHVPGKLVVMQSKALLNAAHADRTLL